jgi:hypothetical protein
MEALRQRSATNHTRLATHNAPGVNGGHQVVRRQATAGEDNQSEIFHASRKSTRDGAEMVENGTG